MTTGTQRRRLKTECKTVRIRETSAWVCIEIGRPPEDPLPAKYTTLRIGWGSPYHIFCELYITDTGSPQLPSPGTSTARTCASSRQCIGFTLESTALHQDLQKGLEPHPNGLSTDLSSCEAWDCFLTPAALNQIPQLRKALQEPVRSQVSLACHLLCLRCNRYIRITYLSNYLHILYTHYMDSRLFPQPVLFDHPPAPSKGSAEEVAA